MTKTLQTLSDSSIDATIDAFRASLTAKPVKAKSFTIYAINVFELLCFDYTIRATSFDAALDQLLKEEPALADGFVFHPKLTVAIVKDYASIAGHSFRKTRDGEYRYCERGRNEDAAGYETDMLSALGSIFAGARMVRAIEVRDEMRARDAERDDFRAELFSDVGTRQFWQAVYRGDGREYVTVSFSSDYATRGNGASLPILFPDAESARNVAKACFEAMHGNHG